MSSVTVRLDSQPARWLANCPNVAKMFAIFLDTVNLINVKLCIMVVLTELYPFISSSV